MDEVRRKQAADDHWSSIWRLSGIAVCAMLLTVNGCGALSILILFRGDCFPTIRVQGRLVHADTGAPLTNAVVGGRVFVDGELVGAVNPLLSTGTPSFPPPEEDGSFEMQFITGGLTPCPAPAFPRPSQVEIIVFGGGCEQRIMIDINQGTVVDIELPDGILEFKDNIEVPPCSDSLP